MTAPQDAQEENPMKIACPKGNVNGSHPLAHDMTSGDVERLVYVLTASTADAETCPADERPDAGEASWSVMRCPVDWLRAARDPEMYAEHIEQMVEQRRHVQRAAS